MLRIHGDRASLLAALVAHWAEQQQQIPPSFRPVLRPRGGPSGSFLPEMRAHA